MGGLRKGGGVRLMVMAVVLTCAVCHSPVLHKVGGPQGWKPGVNYSEWSSHETFYVGDWLYFGFDKNVYNVLEVNETSYEKCMDQNFIKNITRGGRDVFNLTDAKSYYFLSSGGYCFNGMKLAVSVQDFSPSPAPAPTKNGSPSNTTCSNQVIVTIVLAIALAWAVLFHLC